MLYACLMLFFLLYAYQNHIKPLLNDIKLIWNWFQEDLRFFEILDFGIIVLPLMTPCGGKIRGKWKIRALSPFRNAFCIAAKNMYMEYQEKLWSDTIDTCKVLEYENNAYSPAVSLLESRLLINSVISYAQSGEGFVISFCNHCWKNQSMSISIVNISNKKSGKI